MPNISIKIGQKNFSFSGNNVSIVGGKAYIDGKLIDLEDKDKYIVVEQISIAGDCGDVTAETGNVSVQGNAQRVKTMSGDVECSDVTGSVETMSGDVTCGKIGGSVKTMSGDVRVS